ncbi:MAG: tyrosine-type recombinase/integrase [Candidatus Acidiferrum sp.]
MSDLNIGNLYSRKGTKNLYVNYRDENGKRQRRSVRTDDADEAKMVLATKTQNVIRRREGAPERKEQVLCATALDRLTARYEDEEKDSKQNLNLIASVRKIWGNKYMSEIDAATLKEWKHKFLRKGRALATTQRYLQLLRCVFREAGEPWPDVTIVKEENVRPGFFAKEEVKLLLTCMDSDLADFVDFAWSTGTRKTEASLLRWGYIEDGDGPDDPQVIRVPASICKNRRLRIIPIAGRVLNIIERRRQAARSGKVTVMTSPKDFIFTRNGERIVEFRKTWKTACKKAGCDDKLFHDLRRSFARDAIRAGVPQKVTLDMGGWETESIMNRYNITTVQDMAEGLKKMAEKAG